MRRRRPESRSHAAPPDEASIQGTARAFAVAALRRPAALRNSSRRRLQRQDRMAAADRAR